VRGRLVTSERALGCVELNARGAVDVRAVRVAAADCELLKVVLDGFFGSLSLLFFKISRK
jgi:hypothetical protein